MPQGMPGYHPPPAGPDPLGQDPLEQAPPRTRPPGSRSPREQAPHPHPAQCMLGDMGNKRAVCILLEYDLVLISILCMYTDLT